MYRYTVEKHSVLIRLTKRRLFTGILRFISYHIHVLREVFVLLLSFYRGYVLLPGQFCTGGLLSPAYQDYFDVLTGGDS